MKFKRNKSPLLLLLFYALLLLTACVNDNENKEDNETPEHQKGIKWVIVKMEQDNSNDGEINVIETFEYNENGYKVKAIKEFEPNSNTKLIKKYKYGKNGKIEKIKGYSNKIQINTYDRNNNLIKMEMDNGYGDIYETIQVTFINNQVTHSIYEAEDYPGEGPILHTIQIFTLDKFGNRIKDERDVSADGIVDTTNTYSLEYDGTKLIKEEIDSEYGPGDMLDTYCVEYEWPTLPTEKITDKYNSISLSNKYYTTKITRIHTYDNTGNRVKTEIKRSSTSPFTNDFEYTKYYTWQEIEVKL